MWPLPDIPWHNATVMPQALYTQNDAESVVARSQDHLIKDRTHPKPLCACLGLHGSLLQFGP